MIRPVIIALLLLSWTLASGQDIHLTEKVAKQVLNDLAELDRRRKEAVLDSMEIHALKLAYSYKDSALYACRSAVVIAARIERDKDGELGIREKELIQAKKEVRAQKRLKWLGFGIAALVVILSL